MENKLNWISIKDNTPEFDQFMQTWTNRGEIVEAVYVIDPIDNEPWLQFVGGDYENEEITHYIYNKDFPFPEEK